MDTHNITLMVLLGLLVVGIFLGAGQNRKIIVFKDYDDLGLTFLIPVAFFLIQIIYHWCGGTGPWGLYLASAVAALLALKMLAVTFIENGRNPLKTLVALYVKLPLSIIWILNLITLLNPGGKSAQQRRAARGQALVILTLLTPIIALLVVDKSGSAFNPRGWLHGRRGVSHIRNNL